MAYWILKFILGPIVRLQKMVYKLTDKLKKEKKIQRKSKLRYNKKTILNEKFQEKYFRMYD